MTPNTASGKLWKKLWRALERWYFLLYTIALLAHNTSVACCWVSWQLVVATYFTLLSLIINRAEVMFQLIEANLSANYFVVTFWLVSVNIFRRFSVLYDCWVFCITSMWLDSLFLRRRHHDGPGKTGIGCLCNGIADNKPVNLPRNVSIQSESIGAACPSQGRYHESPKSRWLLQR